MGFSRMSSSPSRPTSASGEPRKKILLTGATGYIGKRLLPALVERGYHVVCSVRDSKRFHPPAPLLPHISVIENDLLKPESLSNIPADINGAYYLVHSMSTSKEYSDMELQSAINFRQALSRTKVEQVIYLTGMVNEGTLSDHLKSRKAVEDELAKGPYGFTALRAGIIIGSGSASFEIIRDLVEKLPVMVAPKWLKTRCQPIAIRDVISFLTASLLRPEVYNDNFDIAGPDIVNYKQMLLGYARMRGLRRHIGIVPVLTPRLSSYWLYFITSTPYRLASSLVDSMKVEVVARDNRLAEILQITPLPYEEALKKTLAKIEKDEVVSSWKDSQINGRLEFSTSEFIEVPTHGCFVDNRQLPVKDHEACLDRLWRIGGSTGWYSSRFLWKSRGFMDRMAGGVGLRRGRTNATTIQAGDALDFWRVLYADRNEGRLLLFAEMKLPGEAWLDFKLENQMLTQTATFRPHGLTGRLYWYAVWPFHGLVFQRMLKGLAEG